MAGSTILKELRLIGSDDPIMRVDRNFESLYLQMWGIQHQFTNLIIFIFMNQLLLKIASKWSGESCFAENLKHPQNAPQMKLMNMQFPKSISADESRGPDETLRRSIQVLFFKYSTVFCLGNLFVNMCLSHFHRCF